MSSLADNTAKWEVRKLTKFQGNGGLPVGFEYFTTNPNIPAGSLPLLGGVYSRTLYKDLWNWVQEQTGYLIEESEWQEKSAANEGNVPFYSTGDGTTTFRVPSLNCWVKGANGIEEVGSYLSAGLPNITGKLSTIAAISVWDGKGALFAQEEDRRGQSYASADASDAVIRDISFRASRSSSIYGNSDTVQPKSIVGMWLVKAYGTVTNVGSTDVVAIAQGLTRVENKLNEAAIVGTVIPYAGASLPTGYLPCNGAAVSRETYASLFGAIGETYGSGDGSTTFNLPNLTDKFIQGSDTAGTVKSAGLPNIYGEFAFEVSQNANIKSNHGVGAFSTGGAWGYWATGYAAPTGGEEVTPNLIIMDSSRTSTIYGNSTTVQPPALTMRYIIKY